MTDLCYPNHGGLLTLEQARTAIADAIVTVADTEVVELAQALGRNLAQTVVSPIDIPPQRNAAMDGYAFASGDLRDTFELCVAGTSWAGKPFDGEIVAGQCVRIFTGAVVPEFADSVIPQEQVRRCDDLVTLPADTAIGKNIRAAGSDVGCHDTLITAPKTLTPSDLGLLAAAGIERVIVKRKLKIGFFSTGDELTPLGQPLQSGQIYDSNRYLLAGLLDDPNHDVTDLGVVKDDPQLLEQRLRDAATRFDLLISTGGASVGDADFVKQVLERCGTINFWKLAIKPGKPLAFGKIDNCWFFGLPGNPVAVLVTYNEFVKPALRQLAGAKTVNSLLLRVRCESPLRKAPGRREFQRGILRQSAAGEFTVIAAGGQDSHQLKVASLANCFIVLDADCSGIQPGDLVTVEPFAVTI